jgi:hypothetical protein
MPVGRVAGAAAAADLQQICAEHSLLELHLLTQAVLHTPLQQTSPSCVRHWLDCEQTRGQVTTLGSTQRPVAVSVGSSASSVVQQISPPAVLQSVPVVQIFGQRLAGRQTCSE